MTFPIVNISAKMWSSEDPLDYIFFDKFTYTDKNLIFNKLHKDKLFIDCNGLIYIAIEKVELTDKWRNWLRFIPNVWKREVLFKRTGENWTVDELRNYLLERVSGLTPDHDTEKWKSNLRKAKNHSELINGQ